MTLPDFLIIGAPRCGTTWLKDTLRMHTDIKMPPGEVYFFDNKYDKGIEWYKEIFGDLGEAIFLGEKTSTYLTDPEAAKRIKEIIPNVKMVAILRNPIDRAYSEYKHHITGLEAESFKEAIDRYPPLLERGLYVKHLSRFFKYFDRNQLLVLKFNYLKNNPEAFLESVLGFLGVDVDFARKADTRPRNVSNLASLRDKLQTLNLYWVLEKIKSTRVGEKLRNFIVDKKIGKKPKMNNETRARLQRYYKKPNKELEELLNIELDWD